MSTKTQPIPKAIAELKVAGVLPQHVELRQVKYLNNLIEQDHRFIKRLTKPRIGFFSFKTTLANLTRIRDHEHDTQRTSTRGGKRRHPRADRTGRQIV